MAVDVKDGGTPSGGGARWWYDPKVRAIIFQVTFVVALVAFFAFIVNNTVVNLEKRDIRAGFGFLSEPRVSKFRLLEWSIILSIKGRHTGWCS